MLDGGPEGLEGEPRSKRLALGSSFNDVIRGGYVLIDLRVCVEGLFTEQCLWYKCFPQGHARVCARRRMRFAKLMVALTVYARCVLPSVMLLEPLSSLSTNDLSLRKYVTADDHEVIQRLWTFPSAD